MVALAISGFVPEVRDVLSDFAVSGLEGGEVWRMGEMGRIGERGILEVMVEL